MTISGTLSQVLAARATLLRNNPTQNIVTIKVNRKIILNNNGEMKGLVRRRLDEIMKVTNTHITCVGNFDRVKPPPGLTADSMDMEIMGTWDAVEKARIRCIILLDELCGLHHDTVEIDPRLHNIVAGRKRSTLNKIMYDTLTNIYIPSPFISDTARMGPGVGGSGGGVGLGEKSWSSSNDLYQVIHVTGDKEGVKQAKDMLLALAANKVRMHFIVRGRGG
ncbi:hypothetical protein HK102_001813 [Quaeritorhiza haematococci]|nr:hypothetical protein HK102_001813 [Quaeritorhiza haematococci]